MRLSLRATAVRALALVGILAISALFAAPAGVGAASGPPAALATTPATLTGATSVGSLRITTASLNARGHPTLTSKSLFMVRSGTTVRVYRVAIDSAHRPWYLVHVNSRPGWIAGWLTKSVPVQAAPAWHTGMASSFGVGDGLVGHGMACGGRLTTTVLAVANRTLPCRSHVRIRIGSRTVVAQVLDRGPYVTGRSFDLGPAVCHALNSCNGVFRIEWQPVP